MAYGRSYGQQTQQEGGPGWLMRLLGRPGVNEGMLHTGLGLLAQKDQRGSLGGALGRALPYGLEAGRAAAEDAEWEELVEGFDPQMRSVLRIIGPERGAAFMLQAMQPQQQEGFTLGEDEERYDASGRLIARGPVSEPDDDTPTEIRTFREVLGMSPEDRAAYYDFLAQRQQAETIVNVGQQPSPMDQALAQTNARVFGEGFDRAQSDLTSLSTIQRLEEIIANPKFQDVSGPIWGGRFGELRAQFADDPEAAQLVAEFRTLGGMMTMQKLEEFTGPKTDFEYEQAQRLVNNDPSMTVAQIQAGLERMREVLAESAQRWSSRVLSMDPSALQFDPRQAEAQMELALRFDAMFGGVRATDDLYERYGLEPR